MRTKDRNSIWSQCEATVGLAAVMSEWEMRARDDFPGARAFLRPIQQYAGTLPCTRTPSCGCYHEVVDSGGGHLEAACRCEFNMCESFAVTREDLAVYEIDLRRLSRALCEAVGLEPAWTRLENLHQTYHIGDYYPYEGCRFPVYLTIQHDRCRMERVVYRLCSTGRRPFVLLVPTRLLLNEKCEQAVSSWGSVCFALCDIARILPNGALQIAEYYKSAMRDFHIRIVPAESRTAFFPTPPGSTWGSLYISFPDNDHMTCRMGDVVRRFNFAEVGMRDRRNNGRTKQWDLMLDIAHNGGVLDRSVGDPRSNKKQKQELSEKLRRVFRIEGDPFIYDEISGCWQILVHLSA